MVRTGTFGINTDIQLEFEKQKFSILRDFIDNKTCVAGTERLFELEKEGKSTSDSQCPKSPAVYGDPFFDEILERLTPIYSKIVGKTLAPTYSYARLYRVGETLAEHTDRPACEYSITINLGYTKNWGVKFGGEELYLDKGMAAIYLGCEIPHSRAEFLSENKDDWLCQAFFHYVDTEGPHSDEKFDHREKLGAPAKTRKAKEHDSENREIFFWQFPNVVPSETCDQIVEEFKGQDLFDGGIGSNAPGEETEVNKAVRNVRNMQLPMGSTISAMLVGYGFVANQQAWQCDIDSSHQVEYLKYDEEGRYKAHLDCYPTEPMKISRKLTVLAFLNDDFEGGKFYLQTSESLIYPEQSKGSVIVIPSYLLHGVEDITQGIRHSLVCWINGPSYR